LTSIALDVRRVSALDALRKLTCQSAVTCLCSGKIELREMMMMPIIGSKSIPSHAHNARSPLKRIKDACT